MSGVTYAAHTPLLAAENLSVSLPSDKGPTLVFSEATLTVDAGEVVDVTGPSGSGKSTLLRALARLLPHVTGSLTLMGQAAHDYAPQQWRGFVTLVPQKPALRPGTVNDNLTLAWGLKLRGHEPQPAPAQLMAALEQAELAGVALDRDISRLSVGQQARVALLRAVLTRPRVLLLDESDAALDDASARAVGSLVSEFAAGGGAVVRVRHRADDGLATRRLLLAHARLSEVAR